MLRKLAVALVATTMLAGPVFAQGNSPSTPAAVQTQKAPAITQTQKATTVGQASAAPIVKAAKTTKHHVARVKHRTHRKLLKSASSKAFKTLHAKQAKHFKTSKKVRMSALTHRTAPAKSIVR
jgi:hypothetical protein